MRKARAALALLLAFAVPVRAETTADPLWYLLSTYVLAPDAKAVEAQGDGPADSKGLAALQADLLVLTDGFEGFRDEAQVKETLERLKPRMSPELRPFFKDRASSLDAIYRTLAVTDYTWAQRFPEPPCEPAEARRKLLSSRDGLFQTEKGEASPWLSALLGPQAEGKSAEQALDQASSQAKLTGTEYEKLRARVRKLTMALASDKAVGAARSKLYCSRAAAFTDLAAAQRVKDAVLISAGRVVAQKPEESVFVVVWKNQRAAATLLRTKNGAVLVTDAAIVADTDHPNLFAYSANAKPVQLTATVARRHPELSVAVLTVAEDPARPALSLAETAPAKDELVTAIGHTMISGLWTKTSGLVTKVGEVGFQTDAAISPELSGGPVLNEAGQVAGMLVLRPANTEEGRWPVAVPAPVLLRWLDDPAFTFSTAQTEVIEDDGTAAVLTRARPIDLTEAGLGAWNIPGLPPPPSVPHGVCVQNCGGGSSSGSSYSSGYSGTGGEELGKALGELGAVLILKGIPALFRGIGKLFKGSGKSSSAPSVAERSLPARAEPPPKPEPQKPPDPVLTLTVVSSESDEGVIFTARVTANRPDIKLGGITVDFIINGTQSAAADTDPYGIAVLTVNNPPSVAALKNLDEESAKHPWLTNASRGITKQGACKVTLLATAAAVGTYIVIRAPVVVLTAGGLALKAPKPAAVNACRGLAGATTAAAAAACASMFGEDSVQRPAPAPSSERPEISPVRPVKSDSAATVREGKDLVKSHADSAQDDLKKAEQDLAAEGGGSSDENASPADPGTEPPNDENESGVSNKGLDKPDATDRKLRNLIEDLYKGLRTEKPIGSGSTADAIRHELRTGKQVGNRYHSEKGRQYVRALENWLRRNPTATQQDRQAAHALLRDLTSALGGK